MEQYPFGMAGREVSLINKGLKEMMIDNSKIKYYVHLMKQMKKEILNIHTPIY